MGMSLLLPKAHITNVIAMDASHAIAATQEYDSGAGVVRSIKAIESITSSSGGSGRLSGTYKYVVTFVDDDGVESDPSDPTTITVDSEQVDLVIPTSDDMDRIIYRTEADGDTYYVLYKIEDGTTTTYTDNISDSDLIWTRSTDVDTVWTQSNNVTSIWTRSTDVGTDWESSSKVDSIWTRSTDVDTTWK